MNNTEKGSTLWVEPLDRYLKKLKNMMGYKQINKSLGNEINR